MLRLLARMPLPGSRLDRRPRLGDLAQTLLAPRQFIGDRHPVGNVGRIRSLGFGHQIGDLGLQLRFDLARILIGKRAVPARVGVDLRPVQSDRAHLQNAHLARQLKNLDEQLLDLLQEPPPKRGDRVVVGMIVRRDEPKRHRVRSSPAPASGWRTPPSRNRKPTSPTTSGDDTKPNPSLGKPRSSGQGRDPRSLRRRTAPNASPEAIRPPKGEADNPSADRSYENCSSKRPAALRESTPDSSAAAGAPLSPTGF